MLALLDGYNLLFRAFVSLPASIVDAEGRPINAVYGLISQVRRFMSELEMDRFVCALDSPATPTFRHRLYPTYQGQRGPMGGDNAEDFARQVSLAAEALPQLGIPTPAAAGFEADDIIATLATASARNGEMSLAVSTDRDLWQLVGPDIGVMRPGNPPTLFADGESVRSALGVLPESVPTFKALAGDASDNIPGVRGIGGKTAIALVDQFVTLEALYQHLDDVPPRARTALELQREEALLFRELATLRRDVALGLQPADVLPPEFGPKTQVREALRTAGIPA